MSASPRTELRVHEEDGSKLAALSACEVLTAFERRELTPSAYLAACLENIERVDPYINALTAIDTERAIREASQSSSRWDTGSPIGPLDGLPIGVKDLQETRGLLTTHGSPAARSNVPERDLPMVGRLRAAGAIILAKTNVPELGAGGNSRNPVWGATGNPFNPNLTVGGSSGGSAAALAADLLPLCTGSDTGGSLRLPAALCGVVGYRPSVDVIAHPTRPLGWSGISVLGPMARTMDDLLLMLNVCQGADLDDPLSAPVQSTRFAGLPEVDLGDLKVGYSEDFGGAPVENDIRATFRSRIDLLSPNVKECRSADLNLGDMDRCFDILRAESFLAAFGQAIEQAPEAFGPHILTNVALGHSFSLADRAWAHAEQTSILRRFNALMREFDILVLPTSPVSPFPWTWSHPETVDGHSMDIYYRWLALVYRGSLTGGPAIALPCGRDQAGMPFGLQVLGSVRGDERLLGAARAMESLFAVNSLTTRPRPDTATMVRSAVDLRSIVTHPPVEDHLSGQAAPALRTAV